MENGEGSKPEQERGAKQGTKQALFRGAGSVTIVEYDSAVGTPSHAVDFEFFSNQSARESQSSCTRLGAFLFSPFAFPRDSSDEGVLMSKKKVDRCFFRITSRVLCHSEK